MNKQIQPHTYLNKSQEKEDELVVTATFLVDPCAPFKLMYCSAIHFSHKLQIGPQTWPCCSHLFFFAEHILSDFFSKKMKFDKISE